MPKDTFRRKMTGVRPRLFKQGREENGAACLDRSFGEEISIIGT